MTFRAYIAKRRIKDNPAGDFLADARRDGEFPEATTWQELKSYLIARHACDGAIDAARVVWADYQRRNKKAVGAKEARR